MEEVIDGFTPANLTFARKRAGLTLTGLAGLVELSVSTITKYEAGAHPPSGETIRRLASALNVPAGFLTGPALEELEPGVVSFRALSRTSARQRDSALASGVVAAHLNSWLEERLNLPNSDIPKYERGALDPEGSARRLRFEWNLGYTRIRNMVHLLEAHGARVFSLPEHLGDVDAFSFWWKGTPYALLNCRKTYERGRFDAAHELGHLVMHADIDTPRGREREYEANRFAAAFLMPEDDVLAQGLRNAGVDQVLAAKERWGVAAMALAHRLHDLGITSDWTYAMTCRRLSELGYRRGEPDATPPSEREASQVLVKAFALLRSRGMGQSDVAAALRIHPADLQDLLFGLTLTAVPGVGVRKGRTEQPMLQLVPDGG